MDCLFCKIIKKEIPAKILFEDEKVMVIMDAFPNTPGHSLVIPKTHYEDFITISDEDLMHINKVAKEMGRKLMAKLNSESLTLRVNYGKRQEIKHYHLHLLPETNKKAAETIETIYQQIMD